MVNQKTNKELGDELGVTSRQISKSRRRGWMWKDGKKIKYTAPPPVFINGRKPNAKQTSKAKQPAKAQKEQRIEKTGENTLSNKEN